MPMLAVTKVIPQDEHVLYVEFSDGSGGEVDCSFLLDRGLGADLADPAFFRRVQIDEDSRTVVWPNGLDPAPELLRSRLRARSAAA